LKVCEAWCLFGQLAFYCFFRCNGDCEREITAFALSAVPSLIANVMSLPSDFLETLLMILLEKTKACVHRTCLYLMIISQISNLISEEF